MTEFIYGAFSSKKTAAVYDKIASSIKNGRKTILIVPEQMGVISEGELTEYCFERQLPTYNLEVLNFTRLCDRIFREYGGLCYNYIGRGGRKLIMWQVLSELSDELSVYNNISLKDRNVLSLMLDATDELARAAVGTDKLSELSEKLSAENTYSKLSKKLSDIALIDKSYRELLGESYDNPQDNLPRLAQSLKENKFFSGCDVFFDGFTSFTQAQLNIISRIISDAENVTFALELPSSPFNRNNNPMYDGLYDTAFRLLSLCAECHTNYTEQILKCVDDNAITTLASHVWDNDAVSKIENTSDSIQIYECGDDYDMCEQIAQSIARYVLAGGEYRDNLVIFRNAQDYSGIIDSVFDKYEIPYFYSVRKPISPHCIVRLILSAFAVINYGWAREDVMNYVKSPFTDITDEEADSLEDYSEIWNIYGRRFSTDYEWRMNPLGYSVNFPESAKEKLEVLNDVKLRIFTPVEDFQSVFDGKCTVKEGCRGVFSLLEALHVKEKLGENPDSESIQVWNTVLSVLDEMVRVGEDSVVDSDVFEMMFRVMLDEDDSGNIPSSVDCVSIGSANSIRSSHIKNVHIAGLNLNEFPSSSFGNSVFSEIEKAVLAENEIELSPKKDIQYSGELFVFAKCIAASYGNCSFYYKTSDVKGNSVEKSEVIDRIMRLCPDVQIIRQGSTDIFSRLITPGQSFDYLPALKSTPLGNSLYDVYTRMPDYQSRLLSLEIPLIKNDDRVSGEIANKIFGGNVSLTSSKLSEYTSCRFSYYCRYILNLSDDKGDGFESVDEGNYIHYLLEHFFMMLKTSDGIRQDCSKDEIKAFVDTVTDQYLDIILGVMSKRTNRIIQLFNRLKRNSVVLLEMIAKEIENSEFIPALFELPVKDIRQSEQSQTVPPLKISLPDGNYCVLNGKVDRVDFYVKDELIYTKVIDYKAGNHKTFDEKDLEQGVDLQIFIYLAAILKNLPDSIKKRISDTDCRLLPAGAFYFAVNIPKTTVSPYVSQEEAEREIRKEVKRYGFALDEDDVKSNIHYDKAKEGSVKLKTLEEFYDIFGKVEDKIRDIVGEMRSGRADAVPLQYKKYKNKCKYCKLKPVCRYTAAEDDLNEAEDEEDGMD